MDLSYYKINTLLWCWASRTGARIVHRVSLSMDRPPPARKESTRLPVATPSTLIPKVEAKGGASKMMELHRRFKTWLQTPDPPKAPRLSVPQEDAVPSLDIQEIPAAMRKIHLPVSAALMDRWFAGRLNYSLTDGDEIAERNQDGKPYPSDMYDTTTIKLDWILQFPRAKKQYEYLTNDAIRSPAAIQTLTRILAGYKGQANLLYPDKICHGDAASLHHRFQFQFARVDGTFGEKIGLLLSAGLERNGTPDDLTGALGSFNFYAAIGFARFSLDPDKKWTSVEVRGIWVYVKDNYTFGDQQGGRSQYLGHWSSNGVIVVPMSEAVSASTHIPYIEFPVALGDVAVKGNVYYPVHNSDFRQWAIRHQQGGDFIVYSDRRFVPVNPPITIYL